MDFMWKASYFSDRDLLIDLGDIVVVDLMDNFESL